MGFRYAEARRRARRLRHDERGRRNDAERAATVDIADRLAAALGVPLSRLIAKVEAERGRVRSRRR